MVERVKRAQEWRVEVVLEPFKALMTAAEMGVKGSGEAKSCLGKATGVESEIRGTGEKNRGKKTQKELGRSTEPGGRGGKENRAGP